MIWINAYTRANSDSIQDRDWRRVHKQLRLVQRITPYFLMPLLIVGMNSTADRLA